MVNPSSQDASFGTVYLDLLTSSTSWEIEFTVYPEDDVLQVTEVNISSYQLSLQTRIAGLQTFLLAVTAQSNQFQVQQILTVRLRPLHPAVLNILLVDGTPRGSAVAELGWSAGEEQFYRLDTQDLTVDALFVVSSHGRVECGQDISLDGITNSDTVAHEYNFNVSLEGPGSVEQIAQLNILVFRDVFPSTVRENWNGVIIRYSLSPNSNFLLNPMEVPPFADISQDETSISLEYGVDYDSQVDKIIRFEVELKTADNSQTTLIGVEITIIDENDSEPELVTNINGEPPILNYYLFEVLAGSPAGTIVGVVSSQDVDTVGTIRYSLGGQHHNSFTVDNSGVVRSTVPLRKAVFGSQINLSVSAHDGLHTSDAVQAVVFLTTLDKIDRNLNMTFTGSVVETTAPGQFVTNVSVPNYMNYNFTNFLAFNMFDIDASTGEVLTKRELDRETDRTPTDFSVQAILDTEDQCQLVILGQLVVTITDVNDMSPRFLQTQYNAAMDEESPADLSVPGLIDVEVFDDDDGQNALLSFSLSGPDSQYFQVRSINPNRFTITTSSIAVDLESLPTNSLTFTLTAVDNPVDLSERRSSSTIIIVTVADVNDWTPTFTGPSLPTPVLEGLASTTVTTLTAADGDRTNNDVTYQLVLGGSEFFQINANTGELRTTTTLDRESIGQFFLTIHAVDTGSPRNTGSTTVTVNVEDVNDSPPMFQGTPRLTVTEESCPTTTLLQISASDADAGTNGEVSYSTSDSYFEVSESGDLRCTVPLDHEETQSHLITIVATDGGSPPLTATVTVEVDVTDINDNPPVFNESSYSAVMKTGEWFGDKPIQVVEVADRDSGIFGEIKQLSLTSHADMFVITGGNTGVIRVSPNAPKPTSDVTYSITVKARDGGGLEGETTVTIRVVNDVTSAVQFNQYDFSLSMDEETDYSSSVIGIVSLYDPGVDVEYSVVSDADFLIDKTSGEVTCMRMLDRETSTHRVFIVKAQESALSGGLSEDLTVVNVTITDKNDNSPVFTRPAISYVFDITEDATLNQQVAIVEATDADVGVNAQLEYSFESQTPSISFQIDRSNGRIFVSRQLDREMVDQYRLLVRVSDRGSPTRSETMTVTIGILDVNDVTPHFDTDTIEVTLHEDQLVDVAVLTVSAADEDYGDNATLSYQVQPSSSCPLSVSNEGEITLTSGLDYEWSPQHLCVIYAIDRAVSCPSGCASQRTGSVTIILTVGDVNDNQPQFINHPYTANISRNAAIDDVVTGAVMAVDADSLHGNGLVKYLILSDQDYFRIDVDSGAIIVATSLNNINGDSFRLTIEAHDMPISGLQLTAQTTVDISIVPEQDRPFFNKTYSVTVTEHAGPASQVLVTTQAFVTRPAGTVLCDVTNSCEYSIDESTYYIPDAFVISSATGELRQNNVELDRDGTDDSEGFIFITVRVVDKITGEFRTTRVTVNVLDINDNQPYFENLTATFSVRHSAMVNTIFATLISTDKDEESNPVYSLSELYDPDDLKIGVMPNGSLFVKESLLSWNGTITFDVQVEDGEQMEVSRDTAITRPQQQRVIVQVRGDDYNEHAPVFTHDKYEGTVYALAKRGTSVLMDGLRAVDADNNTVQYSILQGNIRDTIGMNTTTAELYLRYDLDGSIPATIDLHVIAVDVASPPRTGTCLVVITLTNKTPTQCIRQSEFDSLSVDRKQRTLFLSLFIALAVALTAVIIYAFIVTIKWRISVSRGRNYRENVKSAQPEIGEKPRYDPLEGSRPFSGYDGLQGNEDFSSGVRNPNYVSADTGSGSRCSPPDVPRRAEPVPDYD